MKLDDYVNDAIVGYVEVKLNDVIYHKEPVYVLKKEDVPKESNWWTKFKGWLFKW